jgi:hypothetical protein
MEAIILIIKVWALDKQEVPLQQVEEHLQALLIHKVVLVCPQ